MHKTFSYIKTGLKYTTVLLAMIVFIGQIYYGFIKDYNNEQYEVEVSTDQGIDKISEINRISNFVTSDLCEKGDVSGYMMSILNLIFKCSLAFLAGGLISDMKFIKFGII